MSSLPVPKFDGKGNVTGYLELLERCMSANGIVGHYRGDYLIGTLVGSAATWLEGLGDDLQAWTYEDLKERLT